MHFTVSPAELECIVNSLKAHIRQSEPQTVESCFTKAVENGFANYSDIEDILYFSDDRIESIYHGISVERWCEIFSVPRRYFYPRPRRKQSSPIGDCGVSAEDLADLLINLERTGYSIDPLSLVTNLSSKLVKRAFVSDAGLNIIRYEKSRHKTPPIFFMVEPVEMGHGRREEKFKTTTGYKVEVTWNNDSRPIELSVKAPKFRSRPEPKLTKCEVCGLEWYRGDPDSSAEHRKEHKKRLKYLDPQQNPRFGKEYQAEDGLLHIIANPSKWMHREIYLRALAFKRELGYDFVQWGGPNGDTDTNARGYLFINPENIAAGACAFRWREYEDKSFWCLQWIWIAPKYRRTGVLSKHWRTLRQLHGDFLVEGPVSEAMLAFVTKKGEKHLLKIPIVSEKELRPPYV